MGERHQAEIEVVNSQGLHARPAHRIVQLANEFPCRLWVAKGDFEVDAKSIMSLMMLAAEQGVRLGIRAEGPQAREAVAAMVELFESGFGEK
ncbi:MAG: phosphocarrier protein HPr [Planctomycetota bacterium]|nr:MAG: phosphocarrier protein HPr [Planctomycetota bacterium]